MVALVDIVEMVELGSNGSNLVALVDLIVMADIVVMVDMEALVVVVDVQFHNRKVCLHNQTKLAFSPYHCMYHKNHSFKQFCGRGQKNLLHYSMAI